MINKMLQKVAVSVATALTSAVLGQSPANPAAPVERPNVIFILADDLSDREVGCYGNTEFKTPNIDRLAEQGVMFKTAWATPICSPSRVLLLTGQYGYRTGWNNLMGRPFTPKPDTAQFDFAKMPTFPRMLQKSGYATALTGKWQLPGKIPGLVHEAGFDHYLMWAYKYNFPAGTVYEGKMETPQTTSRFWQPGIMADGKFVPTTPDDYGPNLHTDFAKRFIRENKTKPFFIYYSAVQTHTPWEDTPDLARPGQRVKGSFKANLEYLDHLVGDIVSEVEAQGLTDKTVIFFAGDNGSAFNNKGGLSERSVRVPFIVKAPGRVKAGVVSNALVDFSDIAPTVLDFAGVTDTDGVKFSGQSMVPVLRGDNDATGRPWIFSYLGLGRVLRDRDMMLTDPGNGDPIKFVDPGPTALEEDNKDLTESTDPKVVEHREALLKILETLPKPQLTPDTIAPRNKQNKQDE